jgi:hypothetical protein
MGISFPIFPPNQTTGNQIQAENQPVRPSSSSSGIPDTKGGSDTSRLQAPLHRLDCNLRPVLACEVEALRASSSIAAIHLTVRLEVHGEDNYRASGMVVACAPELKGVVAEEVGGLEGECVDDAYNTFRQYCQEICGVCERLTRWKADAIEFEARSAVVLVARLPDQFLAVKIDMKTSFFVVAFVGIGTGAVAFHEDMSIESNQGRPLLCVL